jgi:signal peptidase I
VVPERFPPVDTAVAPEPEPAFSWRAALEIVQALALAVIISVVLNVFVVQVTEVRQRSMESTLFQNDRVLVSKVDYRFGGPQPCDIVVFNPPIDSSIPYVKRVLAVGGERVALQEGRVLVDGRQRDCGDERGQSLPQAPKLEYPFTVPAGSIWVMGDNRQASSDSRSFGAVPNDNVIGKVILRFWPFDRLRFFEW